LRVLMLLSKPITEDPRVIREARTLQQGGHSVTVLQWARLDPDAPREDVVEGIRVVRFGLRAARRVPGAVMRTPFWWRAASRASSALLRETRFDVVHAHDLDTLPVAGRLKRSHGLRVVYDAHEIFAYMIQGHVSWPTPALAAMLERRLLPLVDHLVVAGDAFAAYYNERYKGPITTVHNALWDPPEAWRSPERGPFTAIYIGTLSTDRLFPGLVTELGTLDAVRVVIGGKQEGVYEQVAAAAKRTRNVTFLGRVAHNEVLRRTRSAHAVLAPLDPKNKQYQVQVANKAYDAMAAGRPLITTKGTATGDFAERHGFGLAVPYSAQAVRQAVARLAENPEEANRLGVRGHHLATTEYHWAPQAERLLRVYSRLSR
jgi:glycogen synthase